MKINSFHEWLLLTLITIVMLCACGYAAGYVLGEMPAVSSFEAGFIAFVIMWCKKEDERREQLK